MTYNIELNILNTFEYSSAHTNIMNRAKVTYKPYNVILLEPKLQGKPYKCHYYCRGKQGHVTHVIGMEDAKTLQEAFIGLSNHPLSTPFLKERNYMTLYNKEYFQSSHCWHFLRQKT